MAGTKGESRLVDNFGMKVRSPKGWARGSRNSISV